MATFSYESVGAQGKKKKGSIEAESREKAIASLKQGGSTVISIREGGALDKDLEIGFLEARPKPRDMAVFCRQFVSIIDAGVPVLSAFEMLGEQTENKKLRSAIISCKATIEHGETLAAAMSEHPKIFPQMFITLVEAGEASGSLDISFARMAQQFEKEAKLKATVKKATIYPSVIVVIAIVAVVLLLSFVVPAFEDMLKGLDAKLPALTTVVLGASAFLQERWYIILVVVIAAVFVLRGFGASDGGRRFFGRLAIKLPMVGKLTAKTASARLSRTLSTLLGSGLPLMEALGIAAGTMTNIHFREDVLKARDQVAVGAPLAKQFKEGGLFPPLMHHMISIGEDTGDIDQMLTKLADYYEDEVEQATEQLMAMLEPMIILLLALVIGSIVLAVILPMASMYDGLNSL